MSDLMITVMFEDMGDAANLGGAIRRRTVRVPLTDDQAALVEPRNSWECVALCIIEDAS